MGSDMWFLGTIDLPYIDNFFTPILTNATILVQMICSYFLLFGKKYQRIFSLILFEAFHIYSTTIAIVKYSFFWTILPFLYILFYF
jgi:hypothetical protein